MAQAELVEKLNERLGPKTGLDHDFFVSIVSGLEAHRALRDMARAIGLTVPVSDARLVHSMLLLTGAEIEIDDVIRALVN